MNMLTVSGMVMDDPIIKEDRAIFDLFYVDKNLKFTIKCVAKDSVLNHVSKTIRKKQKVFATGKIAAKVITEALKKDEAYIKL